TFYVILHCVMTNGGKSTLSKSLQQQIPNSCIIAQDSYFKVTDDSEIPTDSHGFKQYDMLSALHMDKMVNVVNSWRRDPETFLRQKGLKPASEIVSGSEEVYVLIVEGFLIFNYRPLNELFDRRFFIEIPYDVCKKRRSLRVYDPPDPPGYFDRYVWPMYLIHRKEMEGSVSGIAILDGQKTKEELLAAVYEDVHQYVTRLKGNFRKNVSHCMRFLPQLDIE
uniref:Nicotinamide riboside kinase 1-like n=1 Tax=Gouania willdenowi TaxID=441366 RepID=A0A8C5H4V3_GOUWI